MNFKVWEITLLGLAALSLLGLVAARTLGAAAISTEGVFTRTVRPSVAFWGEAVVTEVRITPDALPQCGPAASTRAPSQTVLVMDQSGSMAGEPIIQARNAASDFVDLMDLRETGDTIAIVAFDDQAITLQPLTTSRNALTLAIQRIRDGGGTHIADGLATARQALLDHPTTTTSQRVIILLSDGEQTEPGDPQMEANAAKSQGIRVVTVALGAADRAALEAMASSANDFYTTADPNSLLDIYGTIAEGMVGSIGTNVRLQEYYNSDRFDLAGQLYRTELQSDNQIIWQLPFVGQAGRSVAYLLAPKSLGWHTISPTPGSVSLTSCDDQLLSQATPPGPNVLVLFPAWLLYIFPALLLPWLLYRISKLLRPGPTVPAARPEGRRAPPTEPKKAPPKRPPSGADVSHGKNPPPKKR